MKHLLFFFVVLSCTSLTLAQQVGIHLGTNLYLYPQKAQFTNGTNAYEVKPNLGSEIGLSYKMQLSHAWSVEFIGTHYGFRAEHHTTRRNAANAVEFDNILEIEENHLALTPIFHFEFLNRWSFLAGLGFRTSLGGNSYLYDVVNPETADIGALQPLNENIDLFEYTYLDIHMGLAYQARPGFGVYFKYLRPSLEFQDHFSEFFESSGALSFGLVFRIDESKLSPYGN